MTDSPPRPEDEVLNDLKERYKPVLSTAEAAEMLGVSPQKLRELARTGEIPAYRWGKNYRLFRDELIIWLRSQGPESWEGASD